MIGDKVQNFLDQYKAPNIRSIISKYMDSIEGRYKLAVSMIHPARVALEYYEAGLNKSHTSEAWQNLISDIKSKVENFELFLKAIPDEEKSGEPYPELLGLVEQLKVVESGLPEW